MLAVQENFKGVCFALLAEVEIAFVQKHRYTKAGRLYLVPCDEIIYLNHSCNANILDSDRGFDIVVSDIAEGKEATCDYRRLHDADELAFQCLCGD